MKKITLFLFMSLMLSFTWQSQAQLIPNNTCTTSFDDISATGTDLSLGDDGEANITIPFAFTLDGVSSSDLRVGNNGGVLFNATTGEVTTSSTPTGQGFYPFADDIDSDYGTVVWETLGTAPNRRVVIMWNDRPHYNNSESGATFELILHETTNEVTFLYQDTDFGAGNTNNDAASAGILIVGANGVNTYSTNTVLGGVSCIHWTLPSCFGPLDIQANGITTNSVDLSWTPAAGTVDFEYVIQVAGTGEPTAAGIAVTGASNVTDNTLSPGIAYEVYVRANCGGGDFSTWLGPIDFTTNCTPYIVDYTNDFEVGDTLDVCWDDIVNSTSTYANITSSATYANSGTRSIRFYNSSDANPTLLLVSPEFSDLSADKQVKFSVNDRDNATLIVGTMSNPNDDATFTALETLTGADMLDDTWDEKTISFASFTGTDKYVAFKVEFTGTYEYLYMDDFVYEVAPTVAPNCAANVMETVDPSCGNFETVITWDAVADVIGYKLTLGTTPGGTDVLDNASIGNVVSYSYVGTVNTMYYYTIVPFNAAGDASGCLEYNFTTATDGCYCTPSSTSTATYVNDFSTTGGTNNISNLGSGYATDGYGDNSAAMTVTTYAGSSITFSSDIVGGSAGTAIWVDWNQDLIFDDATENVFRTTSYGYEQSAAIDIPNGLADGDYRLRIVTDYYDSTPNDPCDITASRFEAEDYTITVDASLSVSDNTVREFTYFPNPVNDVLSLRAQANIQNISVYNMLGQEVVRLSPNALNSDVNLSQLQDGAYFVKVTINNATDTIRIIKK
ncbi:T9SS type A sorting domain-containing protein [Pontimicrobium sp. IMCC45349]|uniref:T9SS type A sorting domain-containing protein n=1 Tax=Pontimicrobium sp. IMCC45349 TaxID=3391574 RepID=UPI0039A346F0